MASNMGGGSGGPGGSAQMSQAQQNAVGRAILLSSGIRMSQIVFQGAALPAGQSTRLDLLRVGISTGIMCDFTLSMDITVAMTASPAGPWSMINQLKYTDFSGVDRVNSDGLSLWLLNTFKHNQLEDNAIPGVIGNIGNINTNILTFPTATGATQIAYFSLWVPLAYDAGSDLRGAVPSMVNVGQHYLTITPASALVSATDLLIAPYSAGTAIINSLTVDVTQFYIQPQSIAAGQLPGIDLTTIYEINGRNITTAGIQANTPLLINYPNDRAVMSAIHVLEDNGEMVLDETDMTKVELLINSNTVVRQLTPRRQRAIQRAINGGDVPSSVYYHSHRQQPVLTNLFATYQARYSLGTLSGGSGVSKLVAQYESFYSSGQPLSGIAANAG
jgi:hypothetical protein